MNFTVDATGLYAGSYFLELALTSNDTALDGMKIPVIVNVTGDGVWASNYSSCLNISGYSGAVTRDTLKLWNTGCDTLRVNSVSKSTNRLTVATNGFTIAPEDTVYVPYAWARRFGRNLQRQHFIPRAGFYLCTLYYSDSARCAIYWL